MEGIINYEKLISVISSCCLTEKSCGTCEKEKCFIGNCRQQLNTCLKENSEFIDGGMETIPFADTKVYDDESLINALGTLLNECKNCNLYHDEECIINITRSSLEVILLGDYQDYRGSTLLYFNDIKSVNEEISQRVFDAFQLAKKGDK